MARHLEKFGANQILNIHITNSNWKPHLNLLRVLGVSLEMSRDPKNYFSFTEDKFTELMQSITSPSICDQSGTIRLPVTVSNRLVNLGKFVEYETK